MPRFIFPPSAETARFYQTAGMSDLGDRFRVSLDLHGETADGIFIAAIHDRGLTHVRRDSWPTSERDVSRVGEPLLVESQQNHTSGVWQRDDAVVRLALSGSWLHAQAAAPTEERAAETIEELRQLFPLPDPSSSHEVPVTFWTY